MGQTGDTLLTSWLGYPFPDLTLLSLSESGWRREISSSPLCLVAWAIIDHHFPRDRWVLRWKRRKPDKGCCPISCVEDASRHSTNLDHCEGY
jgi:hypothetical protein